MKLVLFDIDGTLVHCGGRTRGPLARALEDVCGTAGSLLEDSFAGKTDDQIVFDALACGGLEASRIQELIPEVKARYIDALDEALDGAAVEVLPGVRETLDRLTAQSSVAVGLLTGNWEEGARWKLLHGGLDGYFSFGAFGDGHRDRSGLPPVALRAAEQHLGRRFDPRDTLIVGDTPNDVRCGQENEISVLALATGFAAFDELRAVGATWVFRDLVEAGFLLPALGLTAEEGPPSQAGGGGPASSSAR